MASEIYELLHKHLNFFMTSFPQVAKCGTNACKEIGVIPNDMRTIGVLNTCREVKGLRF